MMKKTMYFFKTPLFPLLLSVFFSVAWQCRSAKKMAGNDCSERGAVQDFTGLDGCGLLIVTEKGEKLLPAAIDDAGFELQAGQEIFFSYRETPDQMSVCMAEDKIVRITCIRLAEEDRPAIPACLKIEKVEKGSWPADLVTKYRPEKIIRYPYKTDGWAYLFTGKEFYLYDCQGTFIRKASSTAACLEGEVTDVNAGKVIYRSDKNNN